MMEGCLSSGACMVQEELGEQSLNAGGGANADKWRTQLLHLLPPMEAVLFFSPIWKKKRSPVRHAENSESPVTEENASPQCARVTATLLLRKGGGEAQSESHTAKPGRL